MNELAQGGVSGVMVISFFATNLQNVSAKNLLMISACESSGWFAKIAAKL